ncbi:MAG: outer membrane protein assembly factor BamA [Rhodomicrobium sp.]
MSISGWARFALSIVLAAAAAVFANAAFGPRAALAQEGAVIRTIKVTGNSLIEPETVKSRLTFSPGQRYEARKADQSVKALFATGWFSDVHIKFEGGTVTVSVAENPLVNRVVFEGNKDIKAEDLTKEVQIKPRQPLVRGRVQLEVQRILDLYRRQGHYAAQVDPKIIKLDHNRADLVFEIREGPETKVASINFMGNRSFSDAALRGVISTSETGLLDFLKSGTVYDPDRINMDRDLLRRFYLKNGFADMRVLSVAADTDKDGKGFFVTFSIEEGPRYTFGAIELQVKLSALNAGSLKAKITAQPGDIYNAELADKTVEALTLAAAQMGEPFAQVRPRVDRDPVRRTISVTYVIEEGARVFIDRIGIVGNSRTLDAVVRREFRIAEGDAYSKVLVEAGRQRLIKLRYFKEVKITKEPGRSPDRVNLTIAVQEDQTGQFAFSGGYSTTQGVIGDISYTERNLMGTGQYLEVKLSGSFAGDGAFTVGWTEPHFLDTDLAFGIDLFVKNNNYTEAAGYTVAGYEDFRVGGDVRLSTMLTDNLTVSTNYTLMWENVYNADANASLAVKQIEGPAVISSVGYAVIYDTRDNKKKPTSGIYFKSAQDLAGIGGDVDYIRSTADARAYYPVTQDITLAVRAQGGTISGWDGQDVRVVDAFYKGGETIPGFAPAGIGPRDASTGDALGGTTFYAATAELRFPLPFLPTDLGLSGAVFTSAGTLFGTNAQSFAAAYAASHGVPNTLAIQDSSALRASAGASLVWDSPVGALRVDFADVVAKATGDKTQIINFGYSGW